MSEFLRENGEEVQKISYTSSLEFGEAVQSILKNLSSEGIMPEDIVFLAPKRYENSSLAEAGIKVNRLFETTEKQLPYFSTIQSFKVLDSKVVILVDVDKIKDKGYSKLIYTAISRARTLLYVVGSHEFWKNHE